jgi:uncharacterized protein YuzB (UPF0349 family)
MEMFVDLSIVGSFLYSFNCFLIVFSFSVDIWRWNCISNICNLCDLVFANLLWRDRSLSSHVFSCCTHSGSCAVVNCLYSSVLFEFVFHKSLNFPLVIYVMLSKDRMNRNIAHIGIFRVILQSLFKLRENIFYLKWTLNLGNSDQSKDNVEHILQETSRKLLTESLKICETQIQTTLRNINT